MCLSYIVIIIGICAVFYHHFSQFYGHNIDLGNQGNVLTSGEVLVCISPFAEVFFTYMY